MRTNVSFKKLILSSLFTICGLSAFAYSNNDLVYNPIEVDGMKVGEMVYRNDGNTLTNYMNHTYKYDDQQRMTESETMKWNENNNSWEKSTCVRYTYDGNNVTTTYYQWNKKKSAYVLVPEMTVTMQINQQ